MSEQLVTVHSHKQGYFVFKYHNHHFQQHHYQQFSYWFTVQNTVQFISSSHSSTIHLQSVTLMTHCMPGSLRTRLQRSPSNLTQLSITIHTVHAVQQFNRLVSILSLILGALSKHDHNRGHGYSNSSNPCKVHNFTLKQQRILHPAFSIRRPKE